MADEIKYTCADCAYHICSCICINEPRVCDGDCTVMEQRMRCFAKPCSHFVRDDLANHTKQIIREKTQTEENEA